MNSGPLGDLKHSDQVRIQLEVHGGGEGHITTHEISELVAIPGFIYLYIQGPCHTGFPRRNGIYRGTFIIGG